MTRLHGKRRDRIRVLGARDAEAAGEHGTGRGTATFEKLAIGVCLRTNAIRAESTDRSTSFRAVDIGIAVLATFAPRMPASVDLFIDFP